MIDMKAMSAARTTGLIARRIATEVLIVGAAAGLLLLALRLMAPSPPVPTVQATMTGSLFSVGSPLRLRGVSFANEKFSLVLVSSPTCPYCLASESFHRRLNAAAASHRVPLYVVVPRRSDARAYFTAAGFKPSAVREWNDLGGRVPGTPTLIVVDSHSVVSRIWIGRLVATQESDVLDTLANPARVAHAIESGTARFPNFSWVDLSSYTADRFDVIDIRERSFSNSLHPGAIVLPLVEIPYTASIELDPSRLHVIDCSNISAEMCDNGAALLHDAGRRVATVARGEYFQSCQLTTAGR